MSLKNIRLGYGSKDPSYSWDLRRRIKEFNQALALKHPGKQMRCVFSSEKAQIGTKTEVENRNGSSVKITVPAAGFVVYR